VLSPLQRRVAELLRDLPEARDFALAGGAALMVHAGSIGSRATLTSSPSIRLPSIGSFLSLK